MSKNKQGDGNGRVSHDLGELPSFLEDSIDVGGNADLSKAGIDSNNDPDDFSIQTGIEDIDEDVDEKPKSAEEDKTSEDDDDEFIEPTPKKKERKESDKKETPEAKPEEDVDNDTETSDVDEKELIDPFVDLFTDELGWDITEEERPKSVKELVDFVQGLVDEGVKNAFASDEVEAINEFVTNGGDITKYINSLKQALDLDTIDVASETNQKELVRQNLINKGYNSDRISRMINRYAEAGTLAEEAEDALELLKEHSEKEKEAMLETQKSIALNEEKARKEFMANITKELDAIDNVRGVKISSKDKKELYESIFKVDRDGTTKYQREYQKNLAKNIVESAYLTLFGDNLINSVKKSANTDAVRSLQDKLKRKGTPKSSSTSDESKPLKAADVLGGFTF